MTRRLKLNRDPRAYVITSTDRVFVGYDVVTVSAGTARVLSPVVQLLEP